MNKRFFLRHTLDVGAGLLIRLGGISVIVFVALVFIYLFRQVLPLFTAPDMNLVSEHRPIEGRGDVLFLSLERQNQVLLKLTNNQDDAELEFYDIRRKLSIAKHAVAERPVTVFAADAPQRRILALGVEDGQVVLLRHDYEEDFTTGEKLMRPELSYPFGKEPIELADAPLEQVAVLSDERELTLIGYDRAGQLHGKTLLREENLMTGEITRQEQTLRLPALREMPSFMQLFDSRRFLLTADGEGRAQLTHLVEDKPPQQLQLTEDGAALTGLYRILGDSSLLTTDAKGRIDQWFIRVNEKQEKELARIRSFQAGEPVATIRSVENSKSFLALTQSGRVLFINAPAQRLSLNARIADSAAQIAALAISPRANSLVMINQANEHSLFAIDNPHAEISWRRLLAKIWYESYDEPEWIWQASSATDDFEAKYSVIPLTFGTLKAAFYAMLFSAPLGIAGAIYTSFFMGAGLRRRIKPVIELMEAFPTVIIGFIAGLVLAPFFEKHLPGIFTLLILLPLATVGIGFLYSRLPARLRNLVSDGWQSILLIPLFLLIGYLLMQLSPVMELALFDGDLRVWLAQRGIDYNQRNAMVIGIAMGLAVIPSIYSIAEDSLFSVPNNMVQGAYALGATPIQNVIMVVFPASLSGILSALMIGFGRAVGETMIVLMATGNTPVMDMSIFTGLRTLAANIAVEMPESPVGSSHFRILFLCGLILFVFTFVINTLAEIVRHRIRKRYANV